MPATEVTNVSCPFCGLVCDDLVVGIAGGRLRVKANGCGLATTAFEGADADAEPAPSARIAGRAASLADAAKEAARLLRTARLPIVGGLATDVEGARAAGKLADRIGGVLDHMNSATFLRNVMVLQDGGWITTTLSEIRNRADLLIVAGGDVISRFPRFFERCVVNDETLFGDRRCEVIFLGAGSPASAIPGITASTIPCDVSRLAEALGLLRALVAGRRVQAESAAGVPLAAWVALAARMQSARYGAVAWVARDFEYPHAELTIQSLCELIKDLNREGRFAGLPLGGSDGDMTADTVHLWQTGFGSRTSFGQGIPENDGYHHATERLLARGEADALLWISSLNESRVPPPTTIPTIVLGRSGMALEREPEVFIPVGIPGLDHAGHLFRTDRVVALPLLGLRPSTLPTGAEALSAIDAALGDG